MALIETTVSNLEQPSDGSRLRTLAIALLLIGLLSLLGSVPLMRIDAAVSNSIRLAEVPGDIRKAIELSEAFAHASGVLSILICLLLASNVPRPQFWVATAMTAAGGLTANLLKTVFVRARPYTYDADVSTANRDVTGWEFLGSGSFWDASLRSFPSGHTATAWSLAIGLSLLFPRATWMFCVLAALATYQRLYGGAHFPSDTLAGFGIACVMCGLILSIPRVRNQFSGA